MESDLKLSRIPFEEIMKARDRLKGRVMRTPLLQMNTDDLTTDNRKIYLKLENLQETGSFKQRGAGNALAALESRVGREGLREGVFTCSAGNFAQGLAYNARQLHIPCTIIAPDTAPKVKLDAIRRFGAETVLVSYDEWWNVMMTHQYPGINGAFIHPVCNRDVLAGNGTIGLEIVEDLPAVDIVLSPFGGGGLCTGVASAMKSLPTSPRLFACEVDVAAPLTASLQAGKPTSVIDHKPNFVDGMSGKSLFPEMWQLASSLIQDSILLSVDDIARAVRLLAERCHIVAEGAGAAPVAAALGWHSNNVELADKNIVCIISGGNIDLSKLATILNGDIPQ